MSERQSPKSVRSSRVKSRPFPRELQRLLESGALYPGESDLAFAAFREQVATALGGQDDFVDLLLINDIVDHGWEAIRLRKLKSAYLLRHIGQRIYDTLDELGVEMDSAVALMQLQSDGKFARLSEIEAHLIEAGTTYSALEAEVVMENMAALRDYDRMIATAEERRDYHLNELERRHGVRRSRIREEVLDLAGNDYRVVDEATRRR